MFVAKELLRETPVMSDLNKEPGRFSSVIELD